MAEAKTYIDSVKRGRILFLSLAIAIGMSISKITQTAEITPLALVYSRAAIFFVVSYIGLLWAFRFQVNKSSLLFVLTQSSLFVFAETLFLELFFFRKFDRVYEAFLLLALLVLMFVGTYISFLMANVFNVGSFKQIPLLQVGKTTSYILSLLMVYFITFGVLASGFSLFLTVPILALAYSLTVFFHFRHMKIERKLFSSGIYSTVWGMVVLLVAVIFLGSHHELMALVPTAVMFIMPGILMSKSQDVLKWLNIVEYLAILGLAIGINIVG